MAPICLIEALPSGGWRVNDSALCILKNVQQPVQVIAIFGPKGTGKSFLMNKIAETQQGFRLSLPGGPCTEGIWMLCFPHPSLKEHHLVLLDIEGFDTEKGDKRKEIKLFILAVLLSNVFIYNTQGGVTQEELQKLIYVKELPHLVKAASDEETNTCLLASLLPHFIWCSRDTILDLNMGEEILTPEDYLNDVLNARQGAESSVCWINKLFLQPRLYDICEPCPTARFVNLDSLPEDQLAFLFKKQVQTLKEYIFNKGTKTITGGEKATGQMLACLVESLTSSLSEGDVVPLDKVFERVAWKEVCCYCCCYWISLE
ncbi:guanylate-binding protein 3-like [Protopterus annectens]|uniref:guanylate-binding protein 3-like n=1 Tax=Protopterus annectens TaxID=7888 RepID=UPI001CFA5D16|nr:guanylate-binding protein 3-like [Protopterus annectens]